MASVSHRVRWWLLPQACDAARGISGLAPHRPVLAHGERAAGACPPKAPMLSSPLMAVNRHVAHVVSSNTRVLAGGL